MTTKKVNNVKKIMGKWVKDKEKERHRWSWKNNIRRGYD